MVLQGNSINDHSHAHVRNDSQFNVDMDPYDEFTAFEGGASTQNSYSSAFSSPAVTTMYDTSFNLSSSSSTNMGTVSPQELSLNDAFATAPNSAAFTNLTSPSSFTESPAFEPFEDSPLFANEAFVNGTSIQGDPWFSLFPEESNIPQQNVDQSPLIVEEELEVDEQREVAANLNQKKGNRRKTGSVTSPLAASAGIRKREKALPPIIVEDPDDRTAMKRARNTLAARKSRQRKLQRFEEQEDRIAKLEAEVVHWKSIALRRSDGE